MNPGAEMKRLFQDDTGTISPFCGIEFSLAKTLENTEDASVILLWLKQKKKNIWYRIFLDGYYCGVDRFNRDLSDKDLDDWVLVVDRTKWFQGKPVRTASVQTDLKKSCELALTFEFKKDRCRMCYDTTSGTCSITLV